MTDSTRELYEEFKRLREKFTDAQLGGSDVQVVKLGQRIIDIDDACPRIGICLELFLIPMATSSCALSDYQAADRYLAQAEAWCLTTEASARWIATTPEQWMRKLAVIRAEREKIRHRLRRRPA